MMLLQILATHDIRPGKHPISDTILDPKSLLQAQYIFERNVRKAKETSITVHRPVESCILTRALAG